MSFEKRWAGRLNKVTNKSEADKGKTGLDAMNDPYIWEIMGGIFQRDNQVPLGAKLAKGGNIDTAERDITADITKEAAEVAKKIDSLLEKLKEGDLLRHMADRSSELERIKILGNKGSSQFFDRNFFIRLYFRDQCRFDDFVDRVNNFSKAYEQDRKDLKKNIEEASNSWGIPVSDLERLVDETDPEKIKAIKKQLEEDHDSVFGLIKRGRVGGRIDFLVQQLSDFEQAVSDEIKSIGGHLADAFSGDPNEEQRISDVMTGRIKKYDTGRPMSKREVSDIISRKSELENNFVKYKNKKASEYGKKLNPSQPNFSWNNLPDSEKKKYHKEYRDQKVFQGKRGMGLWARLIERVVKLTV